MRVVKATPARRLVRRSFSGAGLAARLERLGLAVTTPVLLLGLWLTYVGQTVAFDTFASDLATGRLVHLSALRSGTVLTPLLDAFPDRAQPPSLGRNERSYGAPRVVADAIYRRVKGGPGIPPLEHVGGLATATGPSGEPVLKAAQIAALKPHLVVRTPDDFQRAMVVAVFVFMAAFWIAHAVRWLYGTTGDAVLLPAVHLLTGLGLMTMLALRDPLRDTLAFVTVARGVAAGCLLWTAIGFVDFENPRLRRAVLAPLGLALMLAVALLIFGSGPAGSGARVNLFGMQPVEAIRLLVVFSLAAYFARRWQFLRELSTAVGLPRRSSPSNSSRAEAGTHQVVRRVVRLPRWKDVRPLAVSITALLTLFFLQGDLGPALVFSCVFLGLYGISRARVPLVLCGFAVLVAGFAAGYALGVPATVTRRVAIALDPWNNALAGGDQISQALWAMSSGGLWGLGPGVGDPQVIPAGHTDLVMAALGEELGFVGFASAVALFALVVWRMLRIAARAPGDYTMFLAAGLTLAVAVQGLVIVAGLLGLLPLAGVVTPFLSYGRSSMLSNFAALAICAAIGRRLSAPRDLFVTPLRVVGWTLASIAAIVLYRAADVHAFHADAFATRANLAQQADGGFRYQYNPRLMAAARDIVRGTISDRNGLPLATSRPKELARFSDRFRQLGIAIPDTCQQDDARCYPLGALAFHVLGESSRQTNWAARNASYVERDFNARLQGFDDRPETITVVNPGTGDKHLVVRRDYRELLPLVRHKGNPRHKEVRALLARNRDLRITLDAGLQLKVAHALEAQTHRAEAARGAAFVLDPSTGDLLASASYPWPLETELSGEAPVNPERILDRARYGLYPPGSTFKLVTAAAALRAESTAEHSTFVCVRLPDGRVGGRVPGATRPIRDDPLDHTPHGAVDLHRGLVVSCNAYFSHLAQRIGARALHDAAAAAQIATTRSPGVDALKWTLPYAGYGQGDVLASPLRMARVAAALAAGGRLRDVRVVRSADNERAPVARNFSSANDGIAWVSADAAARLRTYMREVITNGTGRVLGSHPIAIAGKTGTAEVDHAKSHSWFVGFAPFGGRRQIAFAAIVENAGYGARVAAPLAGDIVSAAHSLGLIQ